MRTLHIPVSTAACLAVLFGASASFAGEEHEEAQTQQPQQVQPQQVQPQQVQPQQPQVIVVQPPAHHGQVGTTQTTAAPFGPQAAERAVETTPNSALLSTGAGLFAISYAPAVVVGAMSDRNEDKRLFIPVAGPWLDLANRDCRARPCGENENINKAALITSGAVQGAGVLMALSSLFIPEEKEVKVKSAEVKVVPMSFGAGAGIGAIGRF